MNSMNESLIKRTTYVTVVLLFLAWLIDYIDRLVIAMALPSIGKQFHLNPVELGLIMTAFFITYAIFQIPGGMLADKIGAKSTMTLAMVLWSGFTALTGAATSYVMLILVRMFFGVSEGIFPGASMKGIAERTTQKTRLTMNGVMIASNSFGSALAPLIAAPLLIMVGWHQAFYYVAGFGVIMAIILWIWLPQPIRAEALVTEASTAASSAEVVREQGIQVKGSSLFRSGVMWKLALMFFGFDIVGWGLVAWVPTYLLTEKHISLANAGALTSIPFFAGTISTILGGVLFDRYLHNHHRRIIVPSCVITSIFLFFMLNSASVGQFIMFESFGIFFMYLAFMPIFGLPMRLLSSRIVGLGTAMVNFGGQAGGAVVPTIMGALVSAFSYKAAFGFLVFGALLAAVGSLWTPESQDEFERAFAKGQTPSGAASL